MYYLLICFFPILTLIGGIFFYSGIPREDWLLLVVFLVLPICFETLSDGNGRKEIDSLAKAIAYPVIYLFGLTPAMLVFGLVGLIDGLTLKKGWVRTTFNISQLATGALLSSLTFNALGGHDAQAWQHGAGAMIVAIFVFILFNFVSVTTIVALANTISWFKVVKRARFALISNFGTGFVGLIFALFVDAYGLPGLCGFALLLIYLSRLLRVAGEISSERLRRMKLEEKIMIDEMTQVLNFRFLNTWLGDPTQEDVAVLFLDIDDFKSFNDLYGHPEGDRVLQAVATTLVNNVRTSDRVIRYGGDEFVILLPGQKKETALLVAERISEKLAELPFANREQPVTLSIGIAASPEDTLDKRQLLMAADQAMYVAKKAGKNQIRLWSPEHGLAEA